MVIHGWPNPHGKCRVGSIKIGNTKRIIDADDASRCCVRVSRLYVDGSPKKKSENWITSALPTANHS